MLSSNDSENIDIPKLYKKMTSDYSVMKDLFEFLNTKINKMEKNHKTNESKLDKILSHIENLSENNERI